MKKIWMTAAAFFLILTMTLNVCAAEEKITISNAEGIPGATVYLTVSLNESVKGDSLAISYTFDSGVLEALVDSHTWSKTGMLQDFDNKHIGVWASDSVTDFKGAVCVLAFRIRDDKAFQTANVACTVLVKNGSSDIGSYTANATISLACNHSFSQWSSSDQFMHTRVCAKCEQKQTQSHTWDSGTMSDHPENTVMEIVTYTCTVCSSTYQTEIPSQGDSQNSNSPGAEETTPATTPNNPVTAPTGPPKSPTNPNTGSSNQGNQNSQGSSTNQSSSNQTGNNHQHNANPGSQNQNNNLQGNSNPSNGAQGNTQSNNSQNGYPVKEDPAATQSPPDDGHDQETLPIAIPIVTNPNTTEHTHDHTQENDVQPQNPPLVNILVLVGFFAVAGISLIYFMKKKK